MVKRQEDVRVDKEIKRHGYSTLSDTGLRRLFGQAVVPGPVRVGPSSPPVSHGRPCSMLRQELQEHLVEGRRILDGHGVGSLGNGHQAAAGNAPHDDLIDQRIKSRRLFATRD